jgi:methionyl aminopeptidase
MRRSIPRVVFEGAKVLDICEHVEKEIIDAGGRPAFPCNIGINEVAAHFTAPPYCSSVVPSNAIVKVDYGVQIEGFLVDSATTISLDPKLEGMIIAAQEALEDAIELIRPGAKFSEIGSTIEKCVARFGYRVVSNLMGHKIERYTIHAGKSVPNVSGIDGNRFEKGEVYAIEPFVTTRTAVGRVTDSNEAYIFRLIRDRPLKSELATRLLSYVRREYRTLPFALRWLERAFPGEDVKSALHEALMARCVAPYHVLVELSNGVVAQAEHTVLLTSDGCEVLTI